MSATMHPLAEQPVGRRECSINPSGALEHTARMFAQQAASAASPSPCKLLQQAPAAFARGRGRRSPIGWLFSHDGYAPPGRTERAVVAQFEVRKKSSSSGFLRMTRA